MFYGIFALLLFSLILIAVEYQSRYSWFFLMMVAGMVITLFSILMYLAKFGNYDYISLKFFNLDYRIFLYLSAKIKLPMSTIARMLNAGIALYLLAVPLFIYDFTHNSDFKWKRIAALFGLVLYFIWFYDPSNAYRIYIGYRVFSLPGLFSNFMSALHQINMLILIIYLCYPIYILYRYMVKNTIRFIRRQIFILASCLAIAGGLFSTILYTGPFMMSPRNAFATGFWSFGTIEASASVYYVAIPIFTVCALFCILLLLLNFRLESFIQTVTDRKIQKNMRRMNELLSDTLHSQKNLLFNILILTKPENGSGPEEALGKIGKLVEQSLSRTSEMLDSLRALRYVFKTNDLIAVIEESIGKVSLPSHIAIAWNADAYPRESMRCRFDSYHVGRVLIELLTNAADAVVRADRTGGLIGIDLAVQFQWVFIIIRDNGTGIRKAARTRLFEPYFSDKAGGNNWGLGLSYAYKVVKAHLGLLRIESRPGEGTMIQIMLPFRKEQKC
ncbi:MAG: sensor histidine kinase [Treponemataceae bacterium]